MPSSVWRTGWFLCSRPGIHRKLHYCMSGVRKIIYRKPLVRKVKVVQAGKRQAWVESVRCGGQLQGRRECRKWDMKPQAKVWKVKGADNCSPSSHAQQEDIVDSNRRHKQPWTSKLVMPLSMVARAHNPNILGAETVGLPFGVCHIF